MIRHDAGLAAPPAAAPAVALHVCPATITAGKELTASWQDATQPSANVAIGLYRMDAPPEAPISSRPTGGATSGEAALQVPADLPPGPYELRLLASAGGALATASLTVVQAGLDVSPSPVSAGKAVRVRWHGISPPSGRDWIGLYTPEASDHHHLPAYQFTRGIPAGEVLLPVPADVPPGAYEARLFAVNGYARLASAAFTVGPTSLSVQPTTVGAGKEVTARWQGISPASAGDWIALYSVGAPDTRPLSSRYTGAAASGEVALEVPPAVAAGDYELRLFADNSFSRLASVPLRVERAVLTAEPPTVCAGCMVTARWSGVSPPSSTDWVVLYRAGAPNSQQLAYAYTGGTAHGEAALAVPPDLPPGTYELRLFAQNGFWLLGRASVAVERATLTAEPATAQPGTAVRARWSGVSPPTGGDWIVLYPAGAPNETFLTYCYTNGTTAASGSGTASGEVALTIPAAATPGAYELRLFAANSFALLASTTVEVIAPTS